MPNFRFGGGLTFHLNPTLKGSGQASGLQANYKDAAGLVLQGDYMFGDRRSARPALRRGEVQGRYLTPAAGLVVIPPALHRQDNSLGVVFTVSF